MGQRIAKSQLYYKFIDERICPGEWNARLSCSSTVTPSLKLVKHDSPKAPGDAMLMMALTVEVMPPTAPSATISHNSTRCHRGMDLKTGRGMLWYEVSS